MQDIELVSLIEETKNGSDDAFEKIVERFEPLTGAVVHRFLPSLKKVGVNSDGDLRQELSLALYRACATYDTKQEKFTFGIYAKRCLENCAVSFVRKATSRFKKEGKAVEKLRSEHTFETFFAGAFAKEDREKVFQVFAGALSSYEYSVFTRYLDGCSASEIATELGKDEKSVNNAVFRSKEKIKDIYKK